MCFVEKSLFDIDKGKNTFDLKNYQEEGAYHLAGLFPNESSSRHVDGKVKLTVYDLLGREIKSIVNGELSMGRYKYEFNESNLASGVYFYRIETVENSGKKFVQTKRMVW